MLSFDPAFRLGENEERPRDSIILSKNSLNYITNAARGYITPLKGTAPDAAK